MSACKLCGRDFCALPGSGVCHKNRLRREGAASAEGAALDEAQRWRIAAVLGWAVAAALAAVLLLGCSADPHDTEPEPQPELCPDVAPAEVPLPEGCYEDEPRCEPSWADMDQVHAPCVRHYYCGAGSCVTAWDCECVAEVQAECGAPLPVACGGV